MGMVPPIQGLFPRNPSAGASLLGLAVDVKRDFGASGSNQSTTGSITSGTNTLSLASAIDFVDGQGISIANAGALPAISAPTAATATAEGTAGTTTIDYAVAALDSSGGVTAAFSFSVTDANADLSVSNYNALSVTAVSSAAGYAWWRKSTGGSSPTTTGLIALTVGTTVSDIGLPVIAAFDVPASAPSTSLGQRLTTTIQSGGGTTALVLAAAASSAVSGAQVAHNDTAALQAAVDAAVSDVHPLVIPSGTYNIDAPISVGGSASVSGHGAFELFGSQGSSGSLNNSVNFPTVSPYFAGSVLCVLSQFSDGLRITEASAVVDLADIAIRFNTPYWATGHGVYAVPPTISAGGYDNGPMSCEWKGLKVFGHDGDHYALYLQNPIYMHILRPRSYGGGGIYVDNDSGLGGHYGNFTVTNAYIKTYVGGSAHAFRLKSTTTQLNEIAIINPGISVGNPLATVVQPTSAQQTFYADSGILALSVVQPSFETLVGSPYTMPDTLWSLDAAGYIATNAGDGPQRYAMFNSFAGQGNATTAARTMLSDLTLESLRDEPSGNVWNMPLLGSTTSGTQSGAYVDGTMGTLRAGPTKQNMATTSLSGTTAGSVTWAMVEQGSAYKKFVAALDGYENTSATAQTITFPTAFAAQASVTSEPSGFGSTASKTTLTLPSSMSGAVSGVLVVEGI